MWRGRRALDGLDEDIRNHIEREVEENRARGMTPLEARRRAHLKFGNVRLVREDTRAVWRRIWIEQAVQDVRHAIRSLRKSRALTTVVVLTLALGIGANTAIFSLLDQVLLRNLPVENPGELVLLDGPGVYQGRTSGRQAISVPMFRGLADASRTVMSGVFARYNTPATIVVNNEAERVFVELVSGEYFATLGVRAALGRTFGIGDDRTPGGHPLVVLSDSYWRRRFGARPGVLGQDVRLNAHVMTIVGVAAPGFSGVDPGQNADVFVPLMMKGEATPTWNDLESWRSRWVNVMGRLRPGVALEQAAAVLNVAYRQLLREDVETALLSSEERSQFVEKTLVVLPGSRGRSTLRAEFSTPLVVLMGMVGLVLFAACANVANLLIARAASKQQDAAIRLALGAGRMHVLWQRLAETLVLTTAGALLGLLVASWFTGILIETSAFQRASSHLSARPDLRVLLFTGGLAIVAALAAGLAPALHRTASTPSASSRPGATSMGGHERVRKALVVAQIALSVLLLAGAGLFVQSLHNLRGLNPGFLSENLLQFSLSPDLSGYSPDRSRTLVRTLQMELAALPGVESVSIARTAAMSDSNPFQTVNVRGYRPSQDENMSPSINMVGPGYFETMGIPLVMGREFDARDDDRAPRVAVINEALASYFWKGQNAVGGRFGFHSEGDDQIEVIGIVRDTKFANLRSEVRRTFFIPYLQMEAPDRFTVYVRHRAGIAGLPAAVRRVVEQVDSGVPIVDMRTMDAQIEESLFAERMVATLAAWFGGLSTMLAVLGLYGVMSYSVSRRTREIGLRMALGARRASVLWSVLREALVLFLAGVLVGLPAALALGRLVEAQLFGLSATDPLTLVAAVMMLAAVTSAVGCLPAHRATAIDPMVALRSE